MADPPSILCAECGQPFDEGSLIRHGNVSVCASCKPAFLQKLAEGVPVDTGKIHYAGFWIRFMAKCCDALIIGIPEVIIAAIYLHAAGTAVSLANPQEVANLIGQLQPIIIGAIFVRVLYETILVGKYGATVGKMVCKIKVVTARQERISYGWALGRAICKAVCGLSIFLTVAYVIAAFDKQKRAGYDFLCQTRVVYR